MKSIPCTVFMLLLVVAGETLAANNKVCLPISKNIARSNSWIMLGGDARGAVRQVVAGEFGKDVDSQKRVLGQFDRCGELLVADITYDKNEGNMMLAMEQHIARVQRGWVAEYSYLVKVKKAGAVEVVDNRQGTINWHIGQHGNIISSTDKFTSMGKDGFTNTTYRYDQNFRLESSVARSSDAMSNGESTWRWNSQGVVIASTRVRSVNNYSYDKQWRELRLNGFSITPVSTLRSVDECQLWDEVGNCTLSYLHETEVFAKGTLERHLASAYKYQYWDRSSAAADEDN